MYYSANYPDILISNLEVNPEISSPNADYSISFAFTQDQKYDYEEYETILKSGIRNFRNSPTYRHYKSYLYEIGINCCQFHPYISNNDEFEMASLEMHHCMLNIYDIASMIMEDTINRYGSITEFDLSDLLKVEHTRNRIPIVMLCKNCHQQYHHKYLYVFPNQIFGKWWELIEAYPLGWTREICEKVLKYLSRGLNEKEEYRAKDNSKLLELRDQILSWSNLRGVTINGYENHYTYTGPANEQDTDEVQSIEK